MPYNKIQPEQIQLATFFSDEGDILINQTDTGVKVNLSPTLTGSFAITGSLSVDGKDTFGLPNTGTNVFNIDSGNLLIQGTDTQIGDGPSDGFNVAIKANDSTISGYNNAIIHGYGATFATGSQQNTLLAGRNATFQTSNTGVVVITDTLSSNAISPVVEQSLYISCSSGHYFGEGKNYFADHVMLDETSSGIFSGNLEILGEGTLTGEEIITNRQMTGYCSGEFVRNKGNQTVSGQKTFKDIQIFETGFQLPDFRHVRQGGVSGMCAVSGNTLCVYMGSAWYGVGLTSL
tara:strand:+ start:732 stop:1601 length:870 start_codon:yes stop_codon:yes gene_type:complete